MKVYIIDIQKREDESETLGPFQTHAGAIKALKKY